MTANPPTSTNHASVYTLPFHHQRVLDIVRANPGLCIQELADRLSLSRSATVHHVRRLLRRGLLQVTRQGRRASHFIAGNPLNPNEKTLLSLLRLRTTRFIVDELRRQPTIAWNELARRLKIGSHSIRWHIARLSKEGLVVVQPAPAGRGHHVAVAPDLLRHLGPALGAPALASTTGMQILSAPNSDSIVRNESQQVNL